MEERKEKRAMKFQYFLNVSHTLNVRKPYTLQNWFTKCSWNCRYRAWVCGRWQCYLGYITAWYVWSMAHLGIASGFGWL